MERDELINRYRARQLRRQARRVEPVVAQAFRRRASEIELELWLRHPTRTL